jgi:ATP-dependent DNA helicase RecG
LLGQLTRPQPSSPQLSKVPAAGGKIWRAASTVANLSELYERIARWEDLHTKFKDWPVHPDDLAASLVAFANMDGGQLILGVANSGVIRGVEDSDRVTRNVDNVAVNNCEPLIAVVQEVLYPSASSHDRPVVVVNIPKGDMHPYRTNCNVYYIRTTSGRRKASHEELLRLFQATESLLLR